MSDRFAICCKSCGHIEDKAWTPATMESHSKRTDQPLTPQGHVPIYCQKCGNRNWQRPASKDQLEAHDARERRESRAVELTKHEDFDGLFKIPEDIRAAPEIKRALSNLLGPLDGEVLKVAQANIQKVARSGMAADSLLWIEYYDRAVQKAIQSVPSAKKATA
jgi:hypothetical protein